MTRSGFIGLAGRPNTGKSTLVNTLVGGRVAIVSERPQTTRRAVRGVATGPDQDWQLVLTDLPGVQRPRDELTKRMQARVEREISDSDAVLFVINAAEGVGPGDRFIAKALLKSNTDRPVICAVNKIDRVSRHELVPVLSDTAQLETVDEVFPVSAKTGEGIEALTGRLIEIVPEGPLLYPADQTSDLPSEVALAELIREQVLHQTRDELPHAVEVQVEEIAREEDGQTVVRANIWAESESQKAILIGKQGQQIKAIGSAARPEIERELDGPVFLDLRVKVRERWRRDESLLDRLGID